MPKTLYDYTYTNPSGYSYKGQVVADSDVTTYNYVAGQSYNAPGGGSYVISGAGTPTTAPSGAVYTNSYTDATGTYDSYHYDPKNATYYNTNTGGYDTNTGNVPAGVPGWSGIGLGNEYSYVNKGSATAPNYLTYGGGGQANYNASPTYTGYDYKFLYPDGSYYLGKVYDNGTYGYSPGYTAQKGAGTYTITGTEPAASTPPDVRAGYNYIDLYHDASGTNYPPSNIVASSPYYQKPVGYGGLGSEKDWIQKPGGYYAFNDTTPASSSTAVPTIPLPT